MKIVASNKKAYFDYEVSDSFEAGIVLTGDEVKSIRAGHINLTGAFAHVYRGELFLVNCHITPYGNAYEKNEEAASRSRKLLVHKRELHRLVGDISRKGFTLIPLKVYFNPRSKIKVEIGLCKHKKAHDKRQTLREKDIKRETDREIKNIRRD